MCVCVCVCVSVVAVCFFFVVVFFGGGGGGGGGSSNCQFTELPLLDPIYAIKIVPSINCWLYLECSLCDKLRML